MKKIYLVLDIDWICDAALSHTLKIIEQFDICATIFVTHDTPILARMRENPKIELGIHPNFIPHNYPLTLNNYYKWAEEIIDACLAIVPEATSTRSHCLTLNNYLLDILREKGFESEVNLYIPWFTQIDVRPFQHWNGILRIPYIWEDYAYMQYIDSKRMDTCDFSQLLCNDDLKVLAFHPAHIFLNSEKMDTYSRGHMYLQNFEILKKFRNNLHYGIENYLLDLLKEAKSRGYHFDNIKEIQA